MRKGTIRADRRHKEVSPKHFLVNFNLHVRMQPEPTSRNSVVIPAKQAV